LVAGLLFLVVRISALQGNDFIDGLPLFPLLSMALDFSLPFIVGLRPKLCIKRVFLEEPGYLLRETSQLCLGNQNMAKEGVLAKVPSKLLLASN